VGRYNGASLNLKINPGISVRVFLALRELNVASRSSLSPLSSLIASSVIFGFFGFTDRLMKDPKSYFTMLPSRKRNFVLRHSIASVFVKPLFATPH
jgi:hypothetical protein